MSPLETALREFESANYGSALKLLKEVLAAEPQNAEAQRFLSLTHFRLAQYDEAEQVARAFLRLRPTDADGHFQLGLILKSRGKSDDARKAFGSALEYDSKHAQAFQELTRLNEFSTPTRGYATTTPTRPHTHTPARPSRALAWIFSIFAVVAMAAILWATQWTKKTGGEKAGAPELPPPTQADVPRQPTNMVAKVPSPMPPPQQNSPPQQFNPQPQPTLPPQPPNNPPNPQAQGPEVNLPLPQTPQPSPSPQRQPNMPQPNYTNPNANMPMRSQGTQYPLLSGASPRAGAGQQTGQAQNQGAGQQGNSNSQGSGLQTCPGCSGRGAKACGACGGSGMMKCRGPGGFTTVEIGVTCLNGIVKCNLHFGENCTICDDQDGKYCSVCKGKGKIPCPFCKATGKQTCPLCGGKGKATPEQIQQGQMTEAMQKQVQGEILKQFQGVLGGAGTGGQ
jgi:hypothetical protein